MPSYIITPGTLSGLRIVAVRESARPIQFDIEAGRGTETALAMLSQYPDESVSIEAIAAVMSAFGLTVIQAVAVERIAAALRAVSS